MPHHLSSLLPLLLSARALAAALTLTLAAGCETFHIQPETVYMIRSSSGQPLKDATVVVIWEKSVAKGFWHGVSWKISDAVALSSDSSGRIVLPAKTAWGAHMVHSLVIAPRHVPTLIGFDHERRNAAIELVETSFDDRRMLAGTADIGYKLSRVANGALPCASPGLKAIPDALDRFLLDAPRPLNVNYENLQSMAATMRAARC